MDQALRVVMLVVVTAVPLVAVGGLRRWPWRYAVLAALGWMIVVAAATFWIEAIEPEFLVWIGAIGGTLATLGAERGEGERRRRSDAILAARSSTPG